METSFESPSSSPAPAPTPGPSKTKIMLGALAIVIIVFAGMRWMPNLLSGLKSSVVTSPDMDISGEDDFDFSNSDFSNDQNGEAWKMEYASPRDYVISLKNSRQYTIMVQNAMYRLKEKGAGCATEPPGSYEDLAQHPSIVVSGTCQLTLEAYFDAGRNEIRVEKDAEGSATATVFPVFIRLKNSTRIPTPYTPVIGAPAERLAMDLRCINQFGKGDLQLIVGSPARIDNGLVVVDNPSSGTPTDVTFTASCGIKSQSGTDSILDEGIISRDLTVHFVDWASLPEEESNRIMAPIQAKPKLSYQLLPKPTPTKNRVEIICEEEQSEAVNRIRVDIGQENYTGHDNYDQSKISYRLVKREFNAQGFPKNTYHLDIDHSASPQYANNTIKTSWWCYNEDVYANSVPATILNSSTDLNTGNTTLSNERIEDNTSISGDDASNGVTLGDVTGTTQTPGGDDHPPLNPPDETMQTGITITEVFVTSQTFTGELGGVAGANQICNNAANSAGRPGLWKALLSAKNPTTDEVIQHAKDIVPNLPIARFPCELYDAGDPRCTTLEDSQELVIATNKDDLFDGTILNGDDQDKGGVSRTEEQAGNHHDVSYSPPDPTGHDGVVWTASNEAGGFEGNDCKGWTSGSASEEGNTGFAKAQNGRWITLGTDTCDKPRALYCIRTVASTESTTPQESSAGPDATESPTSFSLYSGSNIEAENQIFENVTDDKLEFDANFPWSIFGNFDPTKELKGKIRVIPDADYPQYLSLFVWGSNGTSFDVQEIYIPTGQQLVEGSAGTDETAIPPGTPVSIDLPETMENLGLGGITIETTENAAPAEATVSVVSLATVPPLTREGEQVPPLPAGEQTAQAMDISTNISNANLAKVTLTITMPASEIQGDLADYDVRQLVGSTWRDPTLISAKIVGDQAEFTIEVTHFSLFVITKKKTTGGTSAGASTSTGGTSTGTAATSTGASTASSSSGSTTNTSSGSTAGAASSGASAGASSVGGGGGAVSSGAAVSGGGGSVGGGGGGGAVGGGGGTVGGGGGGVVGGGGTVSGGVSGGAVGGGFGAIGIPSTFTPAKPAAEVPVALSSVSVQTKANTATKVALTDTVKKQGIAEWKLTTKKGEKVPVELKVFKNLPAVDDEGKALPALPSNLETKKVVFLKTTSKGIKKSTLTLRLTKDEMKGKSQKDLAVQTIEKGKWKALKIAKLTKGKDGSVTITVDSSGTAPLVVTAKKAEVKKAAAPEKKPATKAKKKK